MADPFFDQLQFVIYDKASVFQRQLIVDGSADLIRNGISTADFTVDDDHEALPALAADGARCAVLFRGQEQFRGKITSDEGEGPAGTVDVHVASDMRKLWEILAWQVPGADIDHQFSSEYRTVTGKSEANFKAVLRENAVTRLGLPWTVAADHGWGTVQPSTSLRMDYIGDKLVDPLTADQLIIVIRYDAAGAWTWDVRQPATIPGVLTVDSGVPDSYRWTREAAKATRVVGGGPGEGVDRDFKLYVDAAREVALGDIIETYLDAQTNEVDEDFTPQLVQAVKDAAATQSVSTELVETDRFEFVTSFQLGDLLHVRLGTVDVTQPIDKVSITCSADEGTVVVPSIGDVDGNDQDVQMARQIARLARGQRDQGRR